MSVNVATLSEDECRILGISLEAKSPVYKPPVSSSQEFIQPPWYSALSYAMTSPDERGCTIFGGRGTGKSTAIRELAKSLNQQYITMQCAASMQIDALIGNVGLDKGSTNFTDGPLAIAVRKGMWLLAEEANTIHPGVWSAVNTLTDKTGEGLRLPTGEVIPNHPEFRLVLLFNEGYQGTREVNAALRDRLMPVYTAYPLAAIEAKMLSGMKPNIPSARIGEIINLANSIRVASLDFDLSIRALNRWVGLKEAGVGTWLETFKVAILDLTGDPKVSAPKRAALAEIANQFGVGNWR